MTGLDVLLLRKVGQDFVILPIYVINVYLGRPTSRNFPSRLDGTSVKRVEQISYVVCSLFPLRPLLNFVGKKR